MGQCDMHLAPDADPHEQIDQLKALTSDVIAEGKKVDDLKKVRGDLLGHCLVARQKGKTEKFRVSL